MAPQDFPSLVGSGLAELGVTLEAWLRAWARVMPSLVLVPAFGGAALPAPARAGLGVALALAIAPALQPAAENALPLAFELLKEFARGLPVAIGAALLVHTALMAGGAMDDLRGARESAALPVFPGSATPLGALLGLLVILSFHLSGGPARLILALTVEGSSSSPLATIAAQISASVGLAVAAAAPLAVAAIVLSVAEALIARAASPAHIVGLLLPLRGVALLAVAALVLDRVLEFLISIEPTFRLR